MTDSNRRTSNVAMEQIIGNMTSGLHNPDGQYIHLGYTPPPSPSEPQLWNSQNQLTKNPYSQFNMHNTEPHTIYSLNQQMPNYNQHAVPPFNYVQPTNMYGNDPYEKSPESNNYVVFQNQNLQDLNGMYHHPDYRFFFSQDVHNSDNNYIRNHVTNSSQNIPNPTQLIDNVVGNWVPNTTGTYSPFGNTQSSSPIIGKIFDVQQENDTNFSNGMTSLYDEMPHTQESPSKKEDLLNFHFTRDTKKPRMVAEVKPMRPSYSDVLTKSAPQANVKPVKLDNLKESKQKKDNKRILKNEKSQKASNSVRLNNFDTKIDRNNVSNIKLNEKIIKTDKSNQLNRKWASLDNVNGSGSDLNEDGNRKNKKGDDSMYNKNSTSNSQQKLGRKSADFEETESAINKNDTLNITKASVKKGNKYNVKQKNTDGFGSSEKPSSGKRNPRIRKRESNIPFGIVGQKIKQYIPGWWRFIVSICMWLLNLISDICSLSVHLSRDMVCSFCKWFAIQWMAFFDTTVAILNRVRFLMWIWEKFTKKKKIEDNGRSFIHSGLQHNITMPTTGEEAMKRLLACKGKDPYSILGVTPTCTDDDIKKYYKRQAFLVHPDKNQQPGAEEAFKILVHAFDMIGEPERRATYDRGVAESAQVEQAWSELTELLAQLQKKVEAAANTIRCSQCNLRHKRIKVDRPSYAARNCTTCKIHHSAREGDIWAEARCLGFLWHYYACMEGGVYDITEWAGCQKESLKHLRPDTHHVQYRIALGKQNGQARRQSSSPRGERPPDLENLLNSLYGNQDASQNARRRNKKSNK